MPQTAFNTLKTPGTAADGGGSGVVWANPNNAKVEDAVFATASGVGPGGGGGTPNQLKTTNFGFNIPPNAVIDGIKLEIKAKSDIFANPSVFLIGSGILTAASTVANPGWAGSLAWLTYGGASDTWGRTWTPAEINNLAFGASMSAFPQTGVWSISVDAVRITVYWHYSVDVAVADVPKRYLYKVYRGNQFLGKLPNVLSKFGYPLDINSAGASITVECGISADTSSQPGNRLVTEAGDPITDEAGNYLYAEGASVISMGNAIDPTLIQNGNRVEVWEYSYYHPNGQCVFRGQINRISAGFGASAAATIKLLILSNGLDLQNFIARGAPFNYTADVTQSVQESYVNVTQAGMGAGWERYGQTWTVGGAVTKLGAIALLLTGSADVTVTVYDSTNATNPLGSVTQHVESVGIQTLVTFGFPSLIPVTPGGVYFFTISVGAGQTLVVYYSALNPYAGGTMFASYYGGGSGGGTYTQFGTGSDLYFITYAGLPTTLATYTLQDPTTGMLKPIIDDYRVRGGKLNYASGSIDATGLSLTVQFNTETILDALKKVLSVAPNGFYFYVDVATDTIYFKKTSTTPTYKLIKGKHLNKIDLVLSIENVVNDVLFSGAEISGTNLYTEYPDQTSQTAYGQRLERKSDNRVSLQPTADAIGKSYIAEHKDEYYETTVTVLNSTMDITLLKPGQTVGLRGFGTFIDRLMLQIVRVEYLPGGHAANLTLGNMPLRFSNEFEDLIRGLLAEQTVANPSAPS